MNTELCFGQKIDEKLGVLQPWYVPACVDRIREMDLSDKVIKEWGSGSSTIWWALMAKEVWASDHNEDWYHKITDEVYDRGLDKKVKLSLVHTHEGDQSFARDLYVRDIRDIKADICIVDGIHRYECAEYAVKVLKPEILIIDNHQQDFVFICPKLDELLEGVRMERFIEPTHIDHEGMPWASAIFYLNEKQ